MSTVHSFQSSPNVDPSLRLNREWGIVTALLISRRLKPYLLLPALAAVLLFTGCSHKDVSDLLSDAKQYQAKGDHRAAALQIKNALQRQPDNGEARYLLGVSSLGLGDLPSAEKEFGRAMELGVDRKMVIPKLAQTLLLQNQYQKALDAIGMLGAAEKPVAELEVLRGSAYLGLGKSTEARRSFDQALKIDPKSAQARLALARLAALDKDLPLAIARINEVLAVAPKDLEAWMFKGEFLYEKGDSEGAIAAYDEAVKANPTSVAPLVKRAAIQIVLGRLDLARRDLDAAGKMAPGNAGLLYLKAQLEFRGGKYREAREHLQEILRVAPDHFPSLLLSGAVELALGAFEQSERQLRRYLDRNPNDAYARKLLAATLMKLKQPQRAIDALAPALGKSPNDLQLLVLLGEAYGQAGKHGKATEFLQRAAALDPKNAALQTRIGVSRLALGDTKEGIASLESAVEIGTFPAADFVLVLAQLGRRDFDKALQGALQLQEKQPKNPVTHNLLGGAYLAKGNIAKARQSFEQALALDPEYLVAAMNLAKLDLQAKDNAAARRRLDYVLSRDASNLEAMLMQAGMERSAGNAKAYVEWLEKAIKANPTAIQARGLLATHYLQTKEPQKALAVASDARMAGGSTAEAATLLGRVQLALGDSVGAVDSYKQLTSLQPNSPIAHQLLGTAQFIAKDISGSVVSFKKALDLKPDFLEARAALAVVQSRAGRNEEALALARQLQKQQPKLPAGFVMEGDAQLADQKFAAAVKAYERALALGSNGLLEIKLHAAQSAAGKRKEADTRLMQWVKQNPQHLIARLYLAERYQSAGESRQAIEQYQIVLKQQPNSVLVLNNIAGAYQQLKDPLALKYAEQAYKLSPEIPAVLDTLGWILFEQGEKSRSIELLRKAVSLAPSQPEARYHLALALLGAGSKADAKRELEAAIATGVKFPQQDKAQALLKQL